jgi:hypothetical protein
MRDAILSTFTVVAVTAVVGLQVAAAEPVPFEQPLPPLPVELDLHDCRIDIQVATAAEPRLRVTTAPGAEGAAADVEVRESGGLILVRRADGGGAAAPTLVVELVLDTAQALQVRGAGLAVSIRSPVIPDTGPRLRQPVANGDDAEQQPPQVAHSYELTDSELHVVGSPAATITGTNTVVHGENGAGDLTVELQRGSLTLRRQRGSVRLQGWDSDCSIQDLEGAVSFGLDGGNLELADGRGRVQGEVVAGFVSVDRWTGDATVTGEEATVEVRDAAINRLELSGNATSVTVDGTHGSTMTVRLTGGSASMEAVRGALELTVADDGRAEITDHEGAVTLTVAGDSVAEATGIDGLVKASVEQSELAIHNAGSLELTARSARISVAGVHRIAELDARDSELELDLRAIDTNRLDLRVVDGSDATVYLPSPCRVQLRESAETSQQVDVTGCEFQMQDMGRWRGGQRRGADGRPTFLLTAKVAESGYLRVRGGP